MLVEWLEAMGHPAASAEHGAAALAQLEAGLGPELILLDLMMPVMDGWTFMREASSRGLLGDTEVWIVSAVESNMKYPDGVRGGLSKPVNLDRLLSIVRRSLQIQKAG